MKLRHLVLLTYLLILTACTTTIEQGEKPSLRLYVMDCGELTFLDIGAFGIDNSETNVRTLFVPCYLIQHPSGQNLLWDAGLDPALVTTGPQTVDGMTLRYQRSVVDQLADVGLAPSDINLLAISHFHFDHAGAVGLFPDSTLLIQESEYQAAFVDYKSNPVYNYDVYSSLADNEMRIVDGDTDVFGDGSVMVISAPGHTAGHQVLFVDLKNHGPLILSGDLYHFRLSRTDRRVPQFNVDAEQTLASMEKIESLVRFRGVTLWIEHDKALAETLKMAPDFYD